jgi:hypothetical protein
MIKMKRREFFRNLAILGAGTLVATATPISLATTTTKIAEDFAIDVSGKIIYLYNNKHVYSIQEFMAWLTDEFDQMGSEDDLFDITSQSPVIRHSDYLLELSPGYTIDAEVTNHLNEGSLMINDDIYTSHTMLASGIKV